MFCGGSENRFLDSEFILNSLKATNSIVRGFLVERIVLASIWRAGLGGVSVSEVKYFNHDSDLAKVLCSNSPGKNTLYIPNQWNYPKIDAVFVSLKSESKGPKTPKTQKSQKPQRAQQQIESEAPTPVVTTDVSITPSTEVLHSYFEIQFIQITIANITAEKLANTRSVLSQDSAERKLWRHAVSDANADVRFSICWLVASDQVAGISAPADKNIIETVSSLESVNSMLKLDGAVEKVDSLE
jgi:hypothetical protein